MALFPIRRPRLGLSIGARRLSLLEIGRDWRRAWRSLEVHDWRERELPAGLVTPSATDRNVSNPASLAGELRTLLGGRRNVSVALSLPDLCARVALFEFEAWPQRPAERDALLRWRFQKDLGVPPIDTRIAFRVFPSAQGATGLVRVLAAAVRREIIEQYEQVCEEAGLLPVTVGLTSLRLFDLCRPAMALAQRDAAASQELFFLHLSEASFSFLALRHHGPVFLRIKPLRNGHTNLTDEVLATLQFYDEGHPAGQNGGSTMPRPLFVVGEASPGRFEPPACGLIDLDHAASLRLRLIPLGWPSLHTSGIGRRPDAQPLPVSALPALAGVWEV